MSSQNMSNQNISKDKNKIGKKLITIDNGNTHCSVGIFNIDQTKNNLIEVVPYNQYHFNESDFLICSNVGPPRGAHTADFELPKRKNHEAFFDMPIQYSASLGDDRLVTSYFIFKTENFAKFPKILVVDAGSFITCDIVSLKGFEGGFIFPGIDRFLLTYSHSQKLPQLSFNQYEQYLLKQVGQGENHLPQNTETAILSALDCYLVAILNKLISDLKISKIVSTGGSGDILNKKVSAKFPAVMDPHLTHSGLSLIHRQHLFPKWP